MSSAISLQVYTEDELKLTQRVSDQTKRFKHFIDDYLNKSTNEGLKAFNIRHKHQWEDVQREVDGAIEEYKKQRSWLHLRKMGRSFTIIFPISRCCKSSSPMENIPLYSVVL